MFSPRCFPNLLISRAKKIEASALIFFATFPGRAQIYSESDIDGTFPVLVPQLISMDVKNHVLIMHDLGIGGTLPDALECFRTTHSLLLEVIIDTAASHFLAVGVDLGNQFALLHSPPCKVCLMGMDYNAKAPNTSQGMDLMRRIKVATIEKSLRMFDVLDSQELERRAAADFDARFDKEFEVFAFGDATLNSILIDGPVFADNRKGLIDWEWSGWGRGINGDMAQLFAEMLLYLTAPRPTQAMQSVIQALMAGMADGYRSSSRRQGSTLAMAKTRTMNEFGGNRRRLPPKIARALRSLYIACGRELIYLALNLPRRCLCCQPEDTKDCEWVKNTIDLGATCLRVAGRNEHEFQSAKNWKDVTDTSALQSVLLSLVFGE